MDTIKTIFRKIRAITIIAAILLSSIPVIYPSSSSASTDSPTYGLTGSWTSSAQCEDAYDKKVGIKPPNNSAKCVKKITGPGAGKWVAFNYFLYIEAGIIVYGETTSANTATVDFKNYWQLYGEEHRNDPQLVDKRMHPYFKKGTVDGEYRYYGWDDKGNLDLRLLTKNISKSSFYWGQ